MVNNIIPIQLNNNFYILNKHFIVFKVLNRLFDNTRTRNLFFIGFHYLKITEFKLIKMNIDSVLYFKSLKQTTIFTHVFLVILTTIKFNKNSIFTTLCN